MGLESGPGVMLRIVEEAVQLVTRLHLMVVRSRRAIRCGLARRLVGVEVTMPSYVVGQTAEFLTDHVQDRVEAGGEDLAEAEAERRSRPAPPR